MNKELIIKVVGVIKDTFNIDGGTFVDLFAVVFIVRLLAPLKGAPPMNNAEAGIWAATIMAFGYSNTNRPKSS